MKVGFIGLGIMGRPMAEHMVKAGLDVMVSDLNEKIVAELVAEGATAGSNKDLAEQCDVVEMILPNASIVKNVIFGEGGLMDYMKAGQIVVDHSSVTANDSTYMGSMRIIIIRSDTMSDEILKRKYSPCKIYMRKNPGIQNTHTHVLSCISGII